jgi:hypothetical protein
MIIWQKRVKSMKPKKSSGKLKTATGLFFKDLGKVLFKVV